MAKLPPTPAGEPHVIDFPVSWIGIDNGITGAFAVLRSTGIHTVVPVPVKQLGGDRFIDASALVEMIRAEPNPQTIYEQGQKQPKWGCKGNFANGFSHAVVDTVLEVLKVPYRGINPKTWQEHAFKDMRGAAKAIAKDLDTKDCSIEFCRRTFPQVRLTRSDRCTVPDNNFADALCMAWYARNVVFRPEFLTALPK